MLKSLGVPKSDLYRKLENQITNTSISFNNHVRKIEEWHKKNVWKIVRNEWLIYKMRIHIGDTPIDVSSLSHNIGTIKTDTLVVHSQMQRCLNVLFSACTSVSNAFSLQHIFLFETWILRYIVKKKVFLKFFKNCYCGKKFRVGSKIQFFNRNKLNKNYNI